MPAIKTQIDAASAIVVVSGVESLMATHKISLKHACAAIGISVEEYEEAKLLLEKKENE